MAAQKLNMYSKKRINALLLYLIWDDVKRTDVVDFILIFLSSSTIKIANEYDNFVSKLLTSLSTSLIKKNFNQCEIPRETKRKSRYYLISSSFGAKCESGCEFFPAKFSWLGKQHIINQVQTPLFQVAQIIQKDSKLANIGL